MTLDILVHPNTTLRTLCSEVETVDKKIKRLCKDMVYTMNTKNGLGLAAPQIGEILRIITFKNQETPTDMIMLNPVIEKSSTQMSILKEGCLSVPDTLVDIVRPSEITVQFTTIKGKRQKKIFTGMNARIIQHEIDHLNGKLIIDYL